MHIRHSFAVALSGAVGVLILALSATALADGGLTLLVESALAVDAQAATVTLPLHVGRHSGPDGQTQTVYFVVIDASDREVARSLGVNWAPKLANALGSAAVQEVGADADVVDFPGTVDFTPEHRVVAGPDGFPPSVAEPGSVADPQYTPLITFGDGVVLNAPQVANDSGVHDKVVDLDTDGRQVTLRLTAGLYHGHDILYLSTESSDVAGAALEESTFTPNLDAAPGIASDDPATSARAAIIPIVNGATGVDNPERQGLVSAVLGEGSPLNITVIHPRNRGEVPTYSPLWDVHPAVWTDAAIAAGHRRRLAHHEEVIDAIEAGDIVSGAPGPANPDLAGLRAAGFVVNCPVITLQ